MCPSSGMEQSESSEILSWAEVNRTHRTRHGIFHSNGLLQSLLTDFGQINPCYPDCFCDSGDRIFYTGQGRRGDQGLSPGNRAMLDAIERAHAVPLFVKLGPGRWQHYGLWRVVDAVHRFDESEKRMLWRFTLARVPAEGLE